MKNRIFNLVLSSLSTLVLLIVLIVDFTKSLNNGYFDSDGYGKSIYLNEQYLFFFYASLALTLCLVYNLVVYKKNGSDSKASLYIGTSLASLIPFSYYAKVFFKTLNKGNGFDTLSFVIMVILLLISIYFIYNLLELLKLKKKDRE